MVSKHFVIVGYSGHAYVVLDACQKMNVMVTGYCDRQEKISNNLFELNYWGNEADKTFDWNKVEAFVLGVGDNHIRAQIAHNIQHNNVPLLTVIHPSAIINQFVQIDAGTFVASNATINPLAKIGVGCIINTASIVEHECSLADFVHLAPGAVLAGNVSVGKHTFIGANSVVKQGVRIGNNVLIGAGSVVLQDIPDNEVWVGNPAKRIK